MASTVLDSSAYASAADIFSGSHTLPQIRSIHKSLHVEIEEKAARLRTQVGNSYRELLGTADAIVLMQHDNERIQDILGRMGGRCGRGVISAKAAGLSSFVAREGSPDARDAARLKLLELCGLMVGRILRGGAMPDGTQMKNGDRLVLATKIYVLGRLLVKNLREEQSTACVPREVVGAAGKASDSLRRRIQRNIERLLETSDRTTDSEDVVKALCAHSLAHSSGAKNSMWHFIRVRQRAMELALDLDKDNERTLTADDVMHSLTLYTKTLLDVQALVPVRLFQALSDLKSQKLLADTALLKLEGLRLDIYKKWCSEEIQDFTPFTKHDDLDATQAKDMLSGFAEKGAQVVVSGLEDTLGQMGDFKSITDLRTRVLQLWIRDGGRVRGLDAEEMQNDLRKALEARLLDVVETKASKLRLVGSEIQATLEGWRSGVSDKHLSLWDDDGYDAALSNGAAPFIEEVVSRLHGRNDAVSKAVNSYKSWYHIIDDVKNVVEELRKQRWDNDYDEIEDEETIEERQRALSREDPKRLQDKLNEMLDISYGRLADHIQELWEQHSTGAHSGSMAIFLIRVLRDIRSQLPDRPAIQDFGLPMVRSLHSQVVAMACKTVVPELISSGLTQRRITTKPLWEGQPSLPTQPSPYIFLFLRDLSLSMTDLGVDLWTPAAMKELKRQLGEELCGAWRKQLDVLAEQPKASKTEVTDSVNNNDNDVEKGGKMVESVADDGSHGDEAERDEQPVEPATGSNKAGAEIDERRQEPATKADDGPEDICTQWLFDVALLRYCIGKGEGDDETSRRYEDLDAALYARSGLDQEARKRLGKTAHDFWGRVSLLFAMLG